MDKLLQVLIVEDSEEDAELELAELRTGGFELAAQRVGNAEALKASLEAQEWNVVILDSLISSQFKGIDALRIVNETAPDIPCVLVSSQVDEDDVAEMMKNGVRDFVPKDKLARLPAVIERELEDVEDQHKYQESEVAMGKNEVRFISRYEALFTGMMVLNSEGTIIYVNRAATEILGLGADEFVGCKSFDTRWLEVKEDGSPFPHEQHPGIVALNTGMPVRGVVIGLFFSEPESKKWILVNAEPVIAHGKELPSEVVISFVDITARKEAEDSLKKLNEELESRVAERTFDLQRVNGELQRFVYVASNDLHEPLMVVSNYLSQFDQQYKDKLDSAADEIINFALDGVKRIQVLLDDMLIYSRVETHGKSFGPVDCDKTLDYVIEGLKDVIVENNAEVTHDQLPALNADSEQIKQLFKYLVDNAIKFHREDESPRIHVSAEQTGDYLLFSVHDNGIGISEDQQNSIFDLFKQMSCEECDGTGIGLAICRKIVERHGGRIWVESDLGKGSTFYFTLRADT